MRERYSSGTIWEKKAGYARAIRVRNIIEVSGTTAVKDGVLQGKNDAYAQAKCIFEIIEKAINGLGGKLSDVVRTRMYVTDINDWQEVTRAHGEFFHDINPASSLVEVKGLIDPDMLVEIEATAITDDE